jgi:hypothetical protein
MVMSYQMLACLGAMIAMPLSLAAPAPAQNVAVVPEALTFDPVQVGLSASLEVEIQSLGPTPLYVHSVFFEDVPPGVFSLPADLSFPPELMAGEVVRVDLTFTPLAEQMYSGNLVVNTNDREDPIVRVPVEGQGFIPEPATALLLGLSMAASLARRPGC